MMVELTFSFVLFLALLGLTIDGSRWLFLHSEVQFIAASAATAGAKQLDGKPGAINRARQNAMAVAGANIATLDALSTAGVTGIAFFSTLEPKTPTTNDAAAAFVEVDIAGEAQRVFIEPVSLTSHASAID